MPVYTQVNPQEALARMQVYFLEQILHAQSAAVLERQRADELMNEVSLNPGERLRCICVCVYIYM